MAVKRVHVPLSLVVDPESRSIDDAELARGLAAESPWAQAETWNRYAPMVYGMAARTLGSESEAEDVVQEVFYRLFAKAKSLVNPDALRAFIVSFAVRILKWELRRKRTRRWLSFHKPAILADVPCDALDFESRDVIRRFYDFLSRQAPREQLVLSLRYLESMTVDEIAAAMDISASTVKRALGCGRTKLSHWIEADPELVGFLGGRQNSDEA